MNGASPLERPGGPRLLMVLWGVCLVGLLVRSWLADRLYPMTAGDPLYSYTYRGLLIADGRWEGVFLMWHPPGYPLVLGGLSAATGGGAHPYWCGVGVSLACYVGLFWVVDRLVAPRVRYAGTRIVVGSFIALYETLFLWATSPLTEPVYLLALFGAVLLLDRNRPSLSRVIASGLVLGAAFTVRLEAVAPTVGIGLYLFLQAYREGGVGSGGHNCRRVRRWMVSHRGVVAGPLGLPSDLRGLSEGVVHNSAGYRCGRNRDPTGGVRPITRLPSGSRSPCSFRTGCWQVPG